jgi:hypothetical protein
MGVQVDWPSFFAGALSVPAVLVLFMVFKIIKVRTVKHDDD